MSGNKSDTGAGVFQALLGDSLKQSRPRGNATQPMGFYNQMGGTVNPNQGEFTRRFQGPANQVPYIRRPSDVIGLRQSQGTPNSQISSYKGGTKKSTAPTSIADLMTKGADMQGLSGHGYDQLRGGTY